MPYSSAEEQSPVKRSALGSNPSGAVVELDLYNSGRVSLPEYMTKTQAERQSHIDLNAQCVEIGSDSQESRALMAHVLGVDLTDKSTKVHLCHACGNRTCSNPYHLYWGTPGENVADMYVHQPDLGIRIKNSLLEKNPDHYSEMGRKGGQRGGGHNKLTPEQLDSYAEQIAHIDLSKWGSLQKVADIWGCSHTHARRIINMLPV